MSLHFFELKKLPTEELTISNKLLLWLSLFKAGTEEELERIKALEEPTMEQAIAAYQRISVSPEFRELERLRSMARHDEASALGEAREQERAIADAEWQSVVDGIVADKDAEIANQAAENEKLRLQIAELQAKVDG